MIQTLKTTDKTNTLIDRLVFLILTTHRVSQISPLHGYVGIMHMRCEATS